MSGSSRTALWRWWPLLAVTYTMAMAQRMAPASLTPLIVQNYHVDWEQLGYFSSAYLLAYMLLQVPAGIATDHFGPRKILLFSVLTSALGTGLMAVAGAYELLLLGRAVTALGDAMVYSVLIKATAVLSSKQRFPVLMSLGQVAGYIGVGLATSPLLLMSTRLGLSATFALITIILAAIALLVLACTSDVEVSGKQATLPVALPSSRVHLLRACAPTLLAFGAYYTAYMVMFSSWGAIVLSKAYRLSAPESASVLLCGVLGLAVGGVINGAILSRVTSKAVPLLVAATLTLALFGVLAALNSFAPVWAFSVVVTLIGLCFGGISNSITVNVRDQAPAEHLSLASALHAVAGNVLAGFLIPIFGGWIGNGPAAARLTLIGAEIVCSGVVIVVGLYLLATRSKVAMPTVHPLPPASRAAD